MGAVAHQRLSNVGDNNPEPQDSSNMSQHSPRGLYAVKKSKLVLTELEHWMEDLVKLR
jgi:hypothetical protein